MTADDLARCGWCLHATHPGCEGISVTAVVRADGCELCDSCEARRAATRAEGVAGADR
jgi:hypothetical protein